MRVLSMELRALRRIDPPCRASLRVFKIGDMNKETPSVSATCSANEGRSSTLVKQLL
jgi:hypothetical protein